MLRIRNELRDGAPVLVLEGRLVGPWVDALRDAARAAVRPPAALDLTGLSFATDDGAELLRQLVARGHRVAAGSGYVQRLLED